MTQERLVQLALRSSGDASFDLVQLQDIHRFIFQDVYPFAGQIREENISKDFFSFASTQYILSYANELFKQLHQENGLVGLDIESFSERAAHYMAEINVLHPFREGNGRTQREFMRQLAQHAGYDLEWSRVDPQRLLRASIRSKTDTQDLIEVIRESTEPGKTQSGTTKARRKT